MSKTEKQIIQALKICKLDTTCVTCPYYGKGEAESCFSRLSADALSIIHKQKKEINRLTHKHYNECGQIAKYSDELQQLTGKKRKYFRKCGVCGERHEQSVMIRTDNSPNGWICLDCYNAEHPEYDADEF